jgi:muramoyltetrapeptide carboxypeptidase
VLKPHPLRAGDRIAVVAPSSAPADLSAIEAGMTTLEARGYKPYALRSPLEPDGYLAAADDHRADDLNHALADPDTRAVFCVRGGYGLLRILDRIDYEAVIADPKLVVGYSDVTSLHMAMLARCGVPGISGPMVAVEWPAPAPRTEHSFRVLAGGETPAPLTSENGDLSALRQGAGIGRLIGGNLTLITRLIGTPFLPDLTGAILFVEEVGEPPYRIDGMLAQLHLSGILSGLAGLVIGGITDSETDRPTLPLDEVLRHYARLVPGPVATELAYGHFPDKHSMPVGTKARLTVDGHNAVLHFLEGVTR